MLDIEDPAGLTDLLARVLVLGIITGDCRVARTSVEYADGIIIVEFRKIKEKCYGYSDSNEFFYVVHNT